MELQVLVIYIISVLVSIPIGRLENRFMSPSEEHDIPLWFSFIPALNIVCCLIIIFRIMWLVYPLELCLPKFKAFRDWFYARNEKS
jgi:hypothetical protein